MARRRHYNSARSRARRVAKWLRHSLHRDAENWKVHEHGLCLEGKEVRIVRSRGPLGWFWQIHVYYRNVEIWLPVLQRILLNRAARRVTLGKVMHRLYGDS